MSRLANIADSINNALLFLGKPDSLKWKVFETTNGKLTAPEIAKILNKEPSNVSLKLAFLASKGILIESNKRGKAIIYQKTPELFGLNLKSYLKNGKQKLQRQEVSNPAIKNEKNTTPSSSKIVNKIIEIGQKYQIENIDQNWLDSLVILNFVETLTTKFLMDHGYSEEDVKKMKWEEKNSRLHDKIQEEARKKGFPLRSSTLSIIKNYREQRNNVDHVGHLASSRINPEEVKLLSHILKVFIKEILEEHQKYCILI